MLHHFMRNFAEAVGWLSATVVQETPAMAQPPKTDRIGIIRGVLA